MSTNRQSEKDEKDVRKLGSAGGDSLEEETPSYRHVKLAPSAPSLIGVGPFEKPSWMIGGPPSKGIAKPSFPVKRQHGSLSMKQEWTSNIRIPSNWVVKSDQLEKVPLDFPLERTHREIDEDASVVASRISDVLRKLSIEAEYDDEKAKAKCRTSDFVSFRIRLYDAGVGGQPVIVELQRRQGPPLSFMRSCKAILNAAQGKAVSAQEIKPKMPKFAMPSGVASMKCLNGVVTPGPTENDAAVDLEKACELFRGEKRDGHLLGMECLCSLTDVMKTNAKVALNAARAVVLGEEKHNVRTEIEKVWKSCALEIAEYLEAKERGMNYEEHIHHNALVVFSNSLTLTAQAGELESAVEDQEWFVEFLIPTLCDAVASAGDSPNNAHLASSCVTCLVSCSKSAREEFKGRDGIKTMEAAREVGAVHHELLAIEAQRCISSMESAAP